MNINIDEITKSSLLWNILWKINNKLDDPIVQNCEKQMAEYIRDMRRIWAGQEKEQSEGKIY